MTAPFTKMAYGSKALDLYAGPTTTCHLTGVVKFTSSSAGLGSVVMLGDPLISLISVGGTAAGGVQGGMTLLSGSPVLGATTPASLKALLTNYRVVGWGIELRNLVPPTAATGRVYVAKVPSVGQYPSWYDITAIIANAGTVTAAELVEAATGYWTGGTNNNLPSSILSLPEAQEYSLQELITGVLGVNGLPVDPRAFWFKPTTAAASFTTGTNDAIMLGGAVGQATVSLGGTPLDSFTNTTNGFEAILIRFDGFPASTEAIEIKYVYHLEGTPVLTSVSAAPVQDNAEPSPHMPGVFESVLSFARENDVFGVMTRAMGRVYGGRAKLRRDNLDALNNMLM